MQSKEARTTTIVVVIAVAISLFFLFRSGDDDAEPAATTPTTAAQTTTGEATDAEQPERKPKPQPERKPKPDVPVIVVAGGEPKDGVAALDYEKGDTVRFDVRSDVDEEIHVHGYDVLAQLQAGKKTEVSFPASLEGIFEVELHGTGALIAELTVEP